MPRFKLKAFDPHNSDAAARAHWEKLQRGETKHKYDLPPTQPGKRHKRAQQQQPPSSTSLQQRDDERLSLTQRRFQAQILAATGLAAKRPRSAPDTEARDKRTIKKDRRAKKDKTEGEEEGKPDKSNTNKRKRTQSEEERQADEQRTRAQWEDKVATIKSKHSTAAATTSDVDLQRPPPPPPREFAGVEHIPFGFQVDRPPQHLPQLKNKRAVVAAGSEAGRTGGRLSMEQYVAERQKAQEAYATMRKRRREAENT